MTSHSRRGKRRLTLVILLLALGPVLFLCLVAGPATKVGDIFTLLIGGEVPAYVEAIFWQIRLPRLIFAFLVGAGLSTAGAALQALLQNPLAEPYTLGISGGATLGVALGLYLVAYYSFYLQTLPFLGFAGALLSAGLVYYLARRREFSLHSLILAGVVISFIFSSLVIVILFFLPADVSQTSLLILVGDLSSVNLALLPVVAGIIIASTGWLFWISPHLNLLCLGEEKAHSLGLKPTSLIKQVFWVTSALAGASVSTAGLIGFVGLIVPHSFRFFVGSDLVYLLPVSALGGGMILAIADTGARVIFYPTEIPVGVVTGIGGGLFFLFLLARKENF